MKEAIERFNDRLRLARASELALAGRYIEAEALVLGGGNRPSYEGYDLLARIQVRNGRFQKAKASWRKSLETGGNEEKIRTYLATLAGHEERVFKKRVLVQRLTLLLWILVTYLAAWICFRFLLRTLETGVRQAS